MCEPVTLGLLASSAIGLVGGMINKPKAPNIQAPTPPPAPAQMPDQIQTRSSNSDNATAGSAGSTLLTGGQGVSPSLLALGKNTLLGQ